MKKITIYLTLLLFSIISANAQYSTGLQNFTAGFSAKIDVSSTLVTLTINAPSDRWFGLAFSTSSIINMNAGDLVAYEGTSVFSDRSLGGIGAYNLDGIQDWTITSNTVASTTRTLVATRVLNTGEAGDFVFTAAPSTIYIAWVRGSSADFVLASHGGLANAGRATQPINFTLGLEDFSLNATQVYPNPSNGNFTVKTKTGLDTINVYSQVGTFVKTIQVNNVDAAEVNLSGLSTGVYLLELLNATDKSWKKIIIN